VTRRSRITRSLVGIASTSKVRKTICWNANEGEG
jgi:hypothetical protein